MMQTLPKSTLCASTALGFNLGMVSITCIVPFVLYGVLIQEEKEF